MTTITLLIAVVMSGLVCVLSPPYALATMIASLLFYPTYLVVQLGVFHITVVRFVVFFFLLRYLLISPQRFRFGWNVLDTLVVVNMTLWVAIPLVFFNWPMARILENRSGVMMDTLFIYLACRLSLRDIEGLSRFIKVLPWILIPLALMGVMESVTGYLPYTALMKYCPWENPGTGIWTPRMGLMRAVGFAGHPINFGIMFVMFIPLFYSLKHLYPRNPGRPLFCLIMLLIGCFSSMSSGPWMMAILMIIFILIEKKRQWIKPLLSIGLLSILGVSIVSNRPFYHVFFSYLNPVGGTSWHRAKLMELAIHHFNEWCLYGYGGRDPGWGPDLGARWTDITNQFIYMGVDYGLFGLVVFVALFVFSIRGLQTRYGSVPPGLFRTLCWSYGSMMAMLLITLNSCTLFDQTRSLLFFQFGVVASMIGMKIPPRRGPLIHSV